MCNTANCKHQDLNDDLGDIFADMGLEAPTPNTAPVESQAPVELPAIEEGFVEPCRKCRGSGRFVGYSGRILGPCFTCKGSGKLTFKTSSADRERSRQNSREAKARKAGANMEAFMAANPDEFAWIIEKAGRFNFATEMLTTLGKFGYLTERQLATTTRLMLQDRERDAARIAAKAEAEANAVAVDITPIINAMEKAFANDIKRPLIRLAEFKFAFRDGTIYVRNRSGDVYYGKIVDGRFFQSRECTAEDEANIVRVAANPEEEAIAYGRREGACAICGRKLTNHESIDRGIGPICAENFGW